MSYLQVQPAIEALHQLEQPATTAAVLSFAEGQSVRTAAWAVRKFGGALLIDKVKHEYYTEPALDSTGRVIPLEDLSNARGVAMDVKQLDAADLAVALTDDLLGGLKRVMRGYPLETVTVRGITDTLAVIGSLERAVEVDPVNLEPDDCYYQAAAQHMLEHMVSQKDGTQQTYLL